MRWSLGGWLGVGLLAACGGEAGIPGPDRHGDTIADGGVDAEAADAADSPIQAPETDGVLEVPFRLGLVASGSERIGAVELSFNTGTVEVAGRTLDAVAYVHPPPFPGWELFQVLAVAPDALYLLWFYCNSS